jgi:glycosyltransferase
MKKQIVKRKIYLFNQTSTAANYGIGRYVEQIIRFVKGTDIVLTVVELYSQNAKEVTVTKEGHINRIIIPAATGRALLPAEKADSRYMRNVAYLLKEHVTDDENSLFHLNYMESEHLSFWLKKLFKVKIILTVHYTNWSFALLGDTVRLKKILKSQNREEPEPDTEAIVKSVERDREIIEQCDRIICIAGHSYDTVKKIYHADKTKLVLMHNGLRDGFRKLHPVQIRRLKEQYHIDPDEKIILFAGRLVELKGVSFLIEAFRTLLTEHEDIRLVIAGNGNFEQLLFHAKKSCVKITFTGYLQKRELYDFYRMADMGVVCSIHEEFGLVAIEMMMHALPLIVTDTGGLSEIVEDNVAGLKVPVRAVRGKRQPDIDILCSRMKWILEHPDEAGELGKQARKRFLKLYELSVWKRNMLEIYNEQ